MSKKKKTSASAKAAQSKQRLGICLYCGKPEAYGSPFCSKECKEAYEQAMKHDQPSVKLYAIGVIAGLILMLYGAVMHVPPAMGVGAIVLGMTFFFMPFLTDSTIRSMGYLRSRKLGRVTGVVLLLLGIWVGWF